MSYKVEAIPNFKKEAKRLVKKFRSLKQELAELADLLEKEPFTGTPLGYDCYKIRLSIESKQKGKSGGARIVTYVYVEQTIVYLLTIFDKSENENVTDKQLKALVEAARSH